MSDGKRWRIAVLNRHFGKRFGGAEHYSAAIVEQLAAHHEVHVFAQEIEHSFPGVSYHQVSKFFKRPRWLNQLWFALITWWLTRRGFDIVHSHENTWHGNVQTVHVRPFRAGLFHQKTGWRRALKWLSLVTSPRLMTYWWLEWARMRPVNGRKVVATSDSVKQEILTAYPCVTTSICAIPPGVEPPPSSHHKTNFREKFNIPLETKLVLFVGNDYIKKGLPVLLEAIASVENLHLAVVGNIRQKPDCLRLAQTLGVHTRVHFLGSLSNIGPAYDAADLLVHPTTEDTYGMVVLEAMAHGLPVIVSSAPFCGIASELTHGLQALILERPHDAALLTSLINLVLTPNGTKSSLAFYGKQFSASRNWQVRSQEYSEIYNEIINH